MKTLLTTLLVSLTAALTVSAAPALLVEATITEHSANDTKKVLMKPKITLESGRWGSLRVGDFECGVTPTLKEDGTVELHLSFNPRADDKASMPTKFAVTARLDQAAEVQSGHLAVTTKTTLAK
jgi:hypothetical protein